MKCSNCGSILSENAKFCRECGQKINLETEALEGLICPDCGNILEKDAAFCNECGKKISNENDNEENIYCPKCGKSQNINALFCGECGAKLTETIDSQINNNKIKKKDRGLIILIVLLIIVIISSATVVYWVYTSNQSIDVEMPNIYTDTSSESSSNEKEIESENNYKTDETYETNVTEKTEKPVQTEEAKQTNEIISDVNTYTEQFSYAYNQDNINENPTYKRVEDSQYSYYCAVPMHFIEDIEGRQYRAPDNTAIMKIIADNNRSNMTVEQAMNEYISEVGGTVTYSAKGDTWFAVSMEKDGIAYYMKGFVDHYIREFSFSFPTEYLGIYDIYINYIEDNFKRTDV